MKKLLWVCDACAPRDAEALTVGVLEQRECCVCHVRVSPKLGNLYRAEELARLGVHPRALVESGSIQ